MWQCRLRGGWSSYAPEVNQVIEAAHQGQELTAEINLNDRPYLIRFSSMRQEQRDKPELHRPVRRMDVSSAAVEDAAFPPTKRARTAGPSAAGSSSSTVSKPLEHIFVFAPGAGGRLGQKMAALHAQFEGYKGCAFCAVVANWNTMNVASEKNLAAVVDAAHEAATAHPGASVHLCGASFGNRVVCEILTNHRARLPAAVSTRAVLCGYPLKPKGQPADGANVARRKEHLLRLPLEARVLLISGDRDEFLGEPPSIAPLREIAQEMKCSWEVYVIPNGGHTVPEFTGAKALGTTQEALNTAIVERMIAFAASGGL
jgi:predicted alpha/beta-hydrolase family hydrolase